VRARGATCAAAILCFAAYLLVDVSGIEYFRHMSKTLLLSHIVFGTKNRERTIPPDQKEKLFRFIWSVLKEHKCVLYRINGMGDHVHMLVDIHPSVAVATLMREVKSKSSQWMKKSGFFPAFDSWGQEYFAESKSVADKDRVINYIKEQETHHRTITADGEFKGLFAVNGFSWFDDDLR